MIDNTNGTVQLSLEEIQFLCNRKFGVGSDGLLLIEKSEEADFHAEFYNPDGSQSFCGNGSRCAVAFAKYLGLAKDANTFTAFDGLHESVIDGETVKIKMKVSDELRETPDGYFINTGSPHVVQFTSNLKEKDIVADGKAIRYNEEYKENGTNVNFVERIADHQVFVRTYERGVENETLSCGTGVTACALAAIKHLELEQSRIDVKTLGGDLFVEVDQQSSFGDIWLCGPAQQVYKGEITI